MKLERALEIVLELADEGVLDDEFADCSELQQERDDQLHACHLVRKLFNLLFREKK